MKAIWKGLIAGIVLIVIGVGIMIATLAINGWAINTDYTMETFTAKDDNNFVELDIGASSLKTEFYDGDKIVITYPSGKSIKTDIEEHKGKLIFESKIKWYTHIFNNPKVPETVVKLPKDKVFDLVVDLGAGTVQLAEGVYGKVIIDVGAGTLRAQNVECNTLICDISAGSATIKGVACSSLNCDISAGKLEISSLICPDIKANVSAGKLSLGVNGEKSEYNIKTSVSAGSCNISNQHGTTDKKINIDCSAGSVTVNFIDS